MTQYGVFNDEGCTDIFDTLADAQAQAAEYRTEDDGYYADLIKVHEICPDHEEQPKDGCEECFDGSEDEPEEDTEAEDEDEEAEEDQISDTHTEPVDFIDVNIGDELVFYNRNTGFDATTIPIQRTGTVTGKTTKTIIVQTSTGTGRLRAADWYDRNVHRTEKADRMPYDADHVQIVDDGTYVTAVWIESPEKAKDPRAVLEAPPTAESVWEYEVVAEAVRHYRSEGAGFSGWVVRSGNEYGDPIPNKREAVSQMKLLIGDYFNR